MSGLISLRTYTVMALVMSSFGCGASLRGEDPSTLTYVVNPGSEVNLASISVGACVHFVLSVTDTSGAPAALTDAVVAKISGYGNALLYSDASCTQAISNAQVTIAAGASGADFYIKDTTSQQLSLTAGADGSTSSSATQVAINAGSATKLGVVSLATSNSACLSFSSSPAVQIQDTYGNLVSSASDSITVSAYSNNTCTTPASGSLTGNTGNTSGGAATFASLVYPQVGTIYLKATSTGGLVSDCSAAISVVSSGAYQLSFSTQPSSTGSAGASFGTPPAVAIKDACGTTVTSSSASVTLAPYIDGGCSASGSGTLNNSTVSASSGIAQFSTLNYTKTGLLYFKATSSGLASACSLATQVSAGSADHVANATGGGQSGAIGVPFPVQPEIQVLDIYGNAVSGTTVDFAIQSGSGTASPTSTSTDVNGYAKTTFTPSSTSSTLRAAIHGFSGTSGKYNDFTFTAASVGSMSALAISGPVLSVLPTITSSAGSAIGVCSAAFTVNTTDGTYTVANSGATVTVTFSSTGSATFYTDSLCQTAATSGVTIANGQSSATFYVSDSVAESVTLTASTISGLTSGTLGVTFASSSGVTEESNTFVSGTSDSSVSVATVTGFVKDPSTGYLYMSAWNSDVNQLQDWIVQKSIDGGVSWTTIEDYQEDDGNGFPSTGANGIVMDASGNLYVVGETLNTDFTMYWLVRKSTDHGATWKTVDRYQYNPGSNGWSVANTIAIDRAGTIYVGGVAYNASPTMGAALVRKSTDGGATWATTNVWQYGMTGTTDFTDNDTEILSIRTDSEGNVYYGGLYIPDGSTVDWLMRKSTDGGVTFTTIGDATTVPGLGGVATSVTAMEIDPSTGYIYAPTASNDASAVRHALLYRSTDSGQTWSQIDDYRLDPNGRATAYAITFDSASGVIYLGGSVTDSSGRHFQSIRKSMDGGTTWSLMDVFSLDGSQTGVNAGINLVKSMIVPSTGHLVTGGPCSDSGNYQHLCIRRY